MPRDPIPPDWVRLESLLDRVLDAPPSERAALVAELSGGDPAIEARLAELAEDAALGLPILDQPAPARFAALLEPEPVRFPPELARRYEPIRELGRGGMATVFLARDRKHAREVAVKVMRPELTAALGRERFLREVAIAAQLRHPAIVPLFDSGEASGALYYVMPYEAGQALRARLAREVRLPVADALAILRDVCEGLGYAHQHGVVHRDVKPDNVLLAGRHAMLTDFGVARAVSAAADDAVLTAGEVPGTPAYMPPERAEGPATDPRGDVYATGVMAFEMLAGVRPFGPASPLERAHAGSERVSEWLLALRPDLPPAVAEVIGRCMAPRPEARYADAGAVLTALDSGRETAPPAGSGRPKRRWVRAAIPAAAALAVLAVAMRYLPGPSSGGDPDLVVVAPFQVLDPSLGLWQEGMADVLARDLDGAGPLRTVPAARALRAWSGGADRSAATALGQRTGAGLVVFGSVVRLDPDSVALRAAVLDRSADRVAAELELRGAEASMGRLADSLAIGILRALGRVRPIGAARLVSFASKSLPALRAFLRGEQFYRRGNWDSALVHFDQAIAEDPGFGLALRRMYQSLTWSTPTAARYRDQREYRQLASYRNQGLNPRDSLIFLADSLRLAAEEADEPSVILRDQQSALAVMREAARRYPDDVEIWYELGEIHFHAPAPIGGNAALAMDAFERSIAADPGFGPAYLHAVGLAVRLRSPGVAARHARAAAALVPEPQLTTLRVAALVLDSGIGTPTASRALRRLDRNSLLRLSEHVGWATDSGEAGVVVLRELLHRREGAGLEGTLVRDSLVRARNLARALAFRGRLAAAAALAGDTARPVAGTAASFAARDPFQELAQFGAVPDSVAHRVFRRGLAPGAEWGGRPLPHLPPELRGAPWWLERRDTVALRRLAERAGTAARERRSVVAGFRGRYLGAVAGAYLALARGDSGAAARQLAAIPDSLCVVSDCFHEKVLLARLLSARGEDREAAALLDRWALLWEDTPTAVLAALDRARIAERLSDRATARDRYRFVAEVWRNADPPLQRYVAEAREGLARVGGGQVPGRAVLPPTTTR